MSDKLIEICEKILAIKQETVMVHLDENSPMRISARLLPELDREKLEQAVKEAREK